MSNTWKGKEGDHLNWLGHCPMCLEYHSVGLENRPSPVSTSGTCRKLLIFEARKRGFRVHLAHQCIRIGHTPITKQCSQSQPKLMIQNHIQVSIDGGTCKNSSTFSCWTGNRRMLDWQVTQSKFHTYEWFCPMVVVSMRTTMVLRLFGYHYGRLSQVKDSCPPVGMVQNYQPRRSWFPPKTSALWTLGCALCWLYPYFWKKICACDLLFASTYGWYRHLQIWRRTCWRQNDWCQEFTSKNPIPFNISILSYKAFNIIHKHNT